MSRRHAKAHPCPTSTKIPYPDQDAADAALNRILRSDRAPYREKEPVRSYRCSCGAWHLTSRAEARSAVTEGGTP